MIKIIAQPTQWLNLLRFALALWLAAVVSVGILPILPSAITPQLITVIVVANVIDGALDAAVRWAVWGGLVFDLLMPTHLGLVWLPILGITWLLILGQRLANVRAQPLGWPVVFALAAFLVALPMIRLGLSWGSIVESALVTAAWGTAALAFLHWVRASRTTRLVPN